MTPSLSTPPEPTSRALLGRMLALAAPTTLVALLQVAAQLAETWIAARQGTAADLVKLAMIAVQHAIDRDGRAVKMVLQVHDELVFEVPDAELPWVRENVPRLMAGVAALKVPLLAEVGVGANWDEAH